MLYWEKVWVIASCLISINFLDRFLRHHFPVVFNKKRSISELEMNISKYSWIAEPFSLEIHSLWFFARSPNFSSTVVFLLWFLWLQSNFGWFLEVPNFRMYVCCIVDVKAVSITSIVWTYEISVHEYYNSTYNLEYYIFM